jgi:hypothetical protein
MIVDKSVLVHESGHAVLGYALGLPVEEVSVIKDGDSYGHVDGLPVWSRYIARSAVFATDPESVHRELLAFVAGSVAEFVESGATVIPRPFDFSRYGGGSDEAKAERLIAAGDGLIQTDLDAIVREAWDMLREPPIWAAVQRVSRELRRFGDIDHDLFVHAFEGDLEGSE